MDQKQLVSFSVVILTIVVVVFASQAHTVDLCGGAGYVPLCRSVVKGEGDPRVALKAAIEHLILETKSARESVVKLDESIKKLKKSQYLKGCKEMMSYTVYSLDQTIRSLNINDKHSVNTHLSGAISSYSSCDDCVKEGGIGLVKVAFGVLNTDTRLKNLASNCLHLSSLVKYGEFHPKVYKGDSPMF